MIYDVILIGIVLLFIVIGAVAGLARSLFGLAAAFVSWLLASWIASPLARWIYSTFIQSSVKNSVSDAVDKLASGAVGSVNEAAEQLPGWLKGALGLSGAELSVGSGLSDSAATAVDTAVQPIIAGALSILLTLVLFIVIRLVIGKLLKEPILALFKLPVINTVNHLLGGVLGAVEGLLTVCILAFLLRLLLPHIASGSGILNESTIYNSFIFYHFYSGNIFTYLTSWIV